MNRIIKFFKSSPKYSIKWSNYFDIYDNLFKKFINKKITFVEVGIGNGGSLFMWRKFFGKKAKIIGIELNPEAKKLENLVFKLALVINQILGSGKLFIKNMGRSISFLMTEVIEIFNK